MRKVCWSFFAIICVVLGGMALHECIVAQEPTTTTGPEQQRPTSPVLLPDEPKIVIDATGTSFVQGVVTQSVKFMNPKGTLKHGQVITIELMSEQPQCVAWDTKWKNEHEVPLPKQTPGGGKRISWAFRYYEGPKILSIIATTQGPRETTKECS